MMCFLHVNVEAYPDPAPAIVEVIALFPGASAEEVEREVTIPLEVTFAGMPGLKKINSKLELELRLQQFIELARTDSHVEAIMHARKHLAGELDPDFGLKAGGLLAHPSDTPVEPYRVRLSHTQQPRNVKSN